MLEKLIRWLFVIGGAAVLATVRGCMVAFLPLPSTVVGVLSHLAAILGIPLAGALLGYAAAPLFSRRLLQVTSMVESDLHHTPTQVIVAGVLGTIVGLVIAVLVSWPFSRLPVIGYYIPVAFTLFFGYLGMQVAIRKREDLFNFFAAFPRSGEKVATLPRDRVVRAARTSPKVLDTSVIIDGRIADVVKTGFIEGVLIVPSFVLEELQRIADSSDLLKRNRGRRGLDILNKMRKEPNVSVQVLERDFGDAPEVDSKLVRLARMVDGKIVTNDFNLNKVAELQGVTVLNINELANAVKPVVLPGEEMMVRVIKDGKESGQGVAYLDDGTMIVVDGGRKFIGEEIGVVVTSVLQTAAGRMIFTRLKAAERALSN